MLSLFTWGAAALRLIWASTTVTAKTTANPFEIILPVVQYETFRPSGDWLTILIKIYNHTHAHTRVIITGDRVTILGWTRDLSHLAELLRARLIDSHWTVAIATPASLMFFFVTMPVVGWLGRAIENIMLISCPVLQDWRRISIQVQRMIQGRNRLLEGLVFLFVIFCVFFLIIIARK